MSTFTERRQAAVLERATTQDALRRFLDQEVNGGRARYRLGHVVTVQPDDEFTVVSEAALGSYVVEVIERIDRDTERSMWATVHDGVADSWRWLSVDQALIHLIARRKGVDDHRGDVVWYASRVIGFDDIPADSA
jgi:hypothetical protein